MSLVKDIVAMRSLGSRASLIVHWSHSFCGMSTFFFLYIPASQMTWPRPPPRTEEYAKLHPLSKMRHAPVPGMRASTSGLVFAQRQQRHGGQCNRHGQLGECWRTVLVRSMSRFEGGLSSLP